MKATRNPEGEGEGEGEAVGGEGGEVGKGGK